MLAVVAELDGANVLLFHVEHFDKRAWECRIAEDGSDWPDLIHESVAESMTLPLPGTGAVVAQWRWKGESEWSLAVPHRFNPLAECEFILRSDLPHHPLVAGEFKVCAAVRGCPSVWALRMPERVLAADAPETITVIGHPVCIGLGQILRKAGEFQCKGRGFTVINAGPSQVTLLRVPAAVPRSVPFHGMFLVKTGRLSDEEIELLKQEAPPWRT